MASRMGVLGSICHKDFKRLISYSAIMAPDEWRWRPTGCYRTQSSPWGKQ
jgi:hypothetical protein